MRGSQPRSRRMARVGGVGVPHVDARPLRRERHETPARALRQLHEQRREVAQGDGRARAEVVRAAHGLGRRRREEQRGRDVVHVIEVARLLAVAHHVDRLALDGGLEGRERRHLRQRLLVHVGEQGGVLERAYVHSSPRLGVAPGT